MSEFRSELGIYFRLIGAQMRGTLQYKFNFVLDMISTGLFVIVDFLMIIVIFNKFPTMNGWNLSELAVLYGIAALSFGIAQLIVRGLEVFNVYIQKGELDRVLVRPVSPLLQLMAVELPLRRLGRIVQTLITGWLGWAGLSVNLTWDKVTLLLITVLAGVIIFIAIHIIGAVITIWTISTVEFVNIFTNGGSYLSSFPLTIYEEWFRNFFLFIVPLGFIAYLPVCYVLDKPGLDGLPAWAAWWGLPVALVFYSLSLLIWRFGLQKYQSTGN